MTTLLPLGSKSGSVFKVCYPIIQPAVLQFSRDGETLDAFGLVNDLLVGTLSPEDWVQKCLHLSIAEETLGVVKAQTIPTARSAWSAFRD